MDPRRDRCRPRRASPDSIFVHLGHEARGCWGSALANAVGRLVNVSTLIVIESDCAILSMGQTRNLFSYNQGKRQSLTGRSDSGRSKCLRVLRVNI